MKAVSGLFIPVLVRSVVAWTKTFPHGHDDNNSKANNRQKDIVIVGNNRAVVDRGLGPRGEYYEMTSLSPGFSIVQFPTNLFVIYIFFMRYAL